MTTYEPRKIETRKNKKYIITIWEYRGYLYEVKYPTVCTAVKRPSFIQHREHQQIINDLIENKQQNGRG